MSRTLHCLLAAVSLCLALTACGGGQGSLPAEKAVAQNEIQDVSESSTEALITGANVTPADAQAWALRAELNRAEVEQPTSIHAQTKSVPAQSKSAGARASTKAAIAAPAAAIYRFFNIQTGAHLFTKTISERDTVLNTLPQFRYEGPVFSAWNSTAAGLSPVYRFYNRQSGAHFYTISEAEKSNILATAPWMSLDGVAYHASPSAQANTTPLYRFYQLQKGFHFYTASFEERNSIMANLPGVYKYEGVGFYVNASLGSYEPALASFAGKANVPGNVNGLGDSARFSYLRGMAFSPAGDLYVTNLFNPNGYTADQFFRSELKKVSPAGLVTSFVGNTQTSGYADGIGSGAEFFNLKSVTFDPQGNAYVADERTVRKVTAQGVVTTIAGSSTPGYVNGLGLAAQFASIRGIARDSAGNLYVSEGVSDSHFTQHHIRKISTTGVVTTFAGAPPTANSWTRRGFADGVGTLARFDTPTQLAFDAEDNLYVADTYNNRVRKITPAGVVTTLAGQSTAGVVNGLGIAAQFNRPYALTVDKATGNVYVADRGGYTVRQVTPSGLVTTVVGTAGNPGVSFGTLPAGIDEVGGMAVLGKRLYIASLNGIYKADLSSIGAPPITNEALAQSRNCMLCHAINSTLLGPSFKDVATKYAGDSTAVNSLATKIMSGSVGVWGILPMPANGQVSETEALTLADWILGLK